MKRHLTAATLVILGTVGTAMAAVIAPVPHIVPAPTNGLGWTMEIRGHLAAFDERDCVPLDQGVTIGGEELGPGDQVSCTLIYGIVKDVPLGVENYFEFDRPIIGLITDSDELTDWDDICGHLAVDYPSGSTTRGLEAPDEWSNIIDASVAVSGNHTVETHVWTLSSAFGDHDEVRVVQRCEEDEPVEWD